MTDNLFAKLSLDIIQEERAKEAARAAMELAQAKKILRDNRRVTNGYAQNNVHEAGKNFIEQAG